MKTEDLIGALVADTETRSAPIGITLTAAALSGAIGSALLFWSLLGPRPDIATALTSPRFLLKFVECAGLAATAGMLASAMLRPTADRRIGRMGVVASALVVVAGVVVEALLVPTAEWGTRLVGTNWYHCLALIPLLALPALAMLLVAARHGASLEPGRTGAIVGVIAGAIGAFFYAANCTDDSPFFVITWYTLAIAATALIGAVMGRRLLKW